jgi:hypothetical protein
MSFVERKDEFFMKKILITYLVVFFSVMTIGNVYSNDEKCIGPYDYKTVYKDYKKIINDYWNYHKNDGICDTEEKDTMLYFENTQLSLLLKSLGLDMLSKVKCANNHSKQVFINKSLEIRHVMNELEIKMNGIDSERYSKWISTQPKIEKYFKSHPGYKKSLNTWNQGCDLEQR